MKVSDRISRKPLAGDLYYLLRAEEIFYFSDLEDKD